MVKAIFLKVIFFLLRNSCLEASYGLSAIYRLPGPLYVLGASLVAQLVKNPPEMWETWV